MNSEKQVKINFYRPIYNQRVGLLGKTKLAHSWSEKRLKEIQEWEAEDRQAAESAQAEFEKLLQDLKNEGLTEQDMIGGENVD